jgi:ParB family chromosome partitioning protein
MKLKTALFGALDTGPTISDLRLEDIRPDPDQPRKTFDEEALRELASSIEQHGLIQPIVVRKDPQSHGKFLITAGERRFRAAALLNHAVIPAIIRDDANAAVVSIIENLQRVDLTPVEEANAVARLIEEQGLNQTTAAKLLGKNRQTINQLLKVHELPEAVRAEAANSAVSKSILIELAQINDARLQMKLWERARENNITVKEVRQAAKTPEIAAEKATPAQGARRLAPIEAALARLAQAADALQAHPMSDEHRSRVHEIINRLNAMTIAAGEPPES